MSKRSITIKSDSALRAAEPAEFRLVDPARTATPFVSFSYSITEVSSVAGRTRVKSSTKRLAGGKLVSEEFEGELEGGAFEQMATQAGEQFAGQLRLLMQPFSWLLPLHRDRGK
jgi:hypothetical protein